MATNSAYVRQVILIEVDSITWSSTQNNQSGKVQIMGMKKKKIQIKLKMIMKTI